MEGQIGSLAFVERRASFRTRFAQTEAIQIETVEVRRHQDVANVAESDEASIKQAIDVGGEEQAIGSIQPFGGSAAHAPGLDMAGNEQVRILNVCQPTRLLELEYAGSKDALRSTSRTKSDTILSARRIFAAAAVVARPVEPDNRPGIKVIKHDDLYKQHSVDKPYPGRITARFCLSSKTRGRLHARSTGKIRGLRM